MSTNSNPGQPPDANNSYGGGYGGYRPSKPSDDPYGATAGPTPAPGIGSAGIGATPQSDPNYVYGQQGQQQYSYGQQQQQQYTYGQPGQQSNAYVPPGSVSGQAGYSQSAPDQKSRRGALLSYLGLCFTGIVFFFLQRKNSFVRFHAAQSVVLFTPLVLAYVVVRLLTVLPVIGVLLGPILGCLTSILLIGGGLLWIFLMVQAYRGSNVRLPIVSEYADAFVARFSKKRTV